MKLEKYFLVCDLCGAAIDETADYAQVRVKKSQHAMIDDSHDYQYWPIDPISNNGRDHLDVCRGCCNVLQGALSYGIVATDTGLLNHRYIDAGKEEIRLRATTK